MNYSMNRERFSVNEVWFNGCQEKPIDLDFTLPDYCPDIKRILKCQVYPQINSKNVVTDRLDIDGTAIIKLMYVDAIKNTIRCCDYKEPFSCSFNLENPVENAMAFTTAKVEYMNCRAVSPRRLDIHGAFSICAKVCAKTDQEILCGVEEEDIQQKREEKILSDVVGLGNQQFSVNETLELGSGKPKVETIIRNDISVILKDSKIIENKVILKAEAIIKMLYLSDIDSGNIETMEYNVPISQIIDVPGVDDNSICDMKIEILNSDIRTKPEAFSEEELISVDIKFAAMIVAYKEKDTSIMTDVYSTKYNLDISHKQVGMPRLVEVISDTYTDKSNIELSSEGISKIIDVFNEIATMTARCEDNKLYFKGKMNVCVLALDEKEEPFYVERMVDLEYTKDWTSKPENIICDAESNLLSISYRINSKNSIEVKIELEIKGAVFCIDNVKLIDNIMADEEKEKEKGSCLTIYYADKGESIWDIARNYCTSVDSIKLENNVNDDILPDRAMLLIPM